MRRVVLAVAVLLAGFGFAPGAVAVPAADPVKPIVVDGPVVSNTTTVAGSKAKFTFSGTAGQKVFTALGSDGPTSLVNGAVLTGPAGEQLGTAGSYVGLLPSGFVDVVVLPTTGTYTITVDPGGTRVGTYTAQVNSVPVPATGSATIDGPTAKLTIAKRGQLAEVRFTGTAGQFVHFHLDSAAVTSGAVTMWAPDGTLMYDDMLWASWLDYEVDRYTLPQTGEYRVLVDPTSFRTGVLDFAVNTIPADAVIPAVVDGAAVAVGNSVPGQNQRMTFTATEGQRIVITCVRIAAEDNDQTFLLVGPDGSKAVGFCGEFDRGILFDTRAMSAGSWSVEIDPKRSYIRKPTLRVLSVPADHVVDSSLGASPSMSLAIGQKAVVRFALTAGQRYFVGCTLANASHDVAVTFELLRPDGTREKTANCYASNGGQLFDTTAAPVAGTWSVRISPRLNAATGATLRLHAVGADVVKTATVGGAAASAATTPGQGARINFTATANLRIKATITASTYPSNLGTVELRNAAGTRLTSMSLAKASTLTYTVPTAGTYSLVVDPRHADAGSATYTVARG
ncbi:hypothetical protein [Kribbella deserti]|uniref:Uncharacterized protein n=1 Tax=Kribbella deserti TaxID=1926257 RepID=A0ABV6QHM9_9ACTN